MTRPARLVLVIGTATDIGKTWVGGEVLARLRTQGTAVAARKPAQSADAGDPGPSDAAVLAAATGEPVDEVCLPHRTYHVAMAPPMAADATGRPVEVSAVAEGAALGAAFLGRMAAGLESSINDAARWAATERIVDPHPAWAAAVEDRYHRFLELSARPSRAIQRDTYRVELGWCDD